MRLRAVVSAPDASSSLINGVPAGVYSGADTTYIWQEGLEYTTDNWAMWNTTRLYPEIAPGGHSVSFPCPQPGQAQTLLAMAVFPDGRRVESTVVVGGFSDQTSELANVDIEA